MAKARDYGTTKAVVARLIDDAGGAKQAAFIVERAASVVYSYADSDVEAQMSFDMARRLAAASGSRALADDAAAMAGGVFMPIEADEASVNALAAQHAHEHGRVVTQLFVSLADLKVSAVEARDLIKRVDDELRALVGLRAHLTKTVDGK
jgi:hypothetical protein